MSDAPKARPSITPKPDGPYLAQGLEKLSSRKGPIETKPAMALCRCGRSGNKPFCDGTHAKTGFSSAKLDGRAPDRRDDYRGEKITIHDNRGLCAHAARCTEGLPSVFRYGHEPWIDPNGAPAPEAAAAIRQCPSGALTYTLAGDPPGPASAAEPAIFVAPNGPYVVTGAPALLETNFGAGAPREHFTLCRCGGSRNKPFCDGTHWNNGFVDDKN